MYNFYFTMKFSVDLVKNSARLGNISKIERLPSVQFETPMLMHYTKAGSLPHISREVYDMTINSPQGLMIPLENAYTLAGSLKNFQEGISKFAVMNDCISYMTVQDFGVPLHLGYNERDEIAIWTRKGKVMLNGDKYMDLIEAFKPDIYHTLCDVNTTSKSSSKRLRKAISNTNYFFKICMERHESSKHLKEHSIVFASITGGYDLASRTESIKNLLESEYLPKISGIDIGGITHTANESNPDEFQQDLDVISHVINMVPVNLIRSVSGCFTPMQVLQLVAIGVDIFESTYAYIQTSKNCALVFPFTLDLKTVNLKLFLEEEKYVDDFRPILEGCKCLTCTKHTRAYINHLIKTKELLGAVLLMIHNSHHYIEFFKVIRQAVKDDTFGIYNQLSKPELVLETITNL